MTKKEIIKLILHVLVAAATAALTALGMTSCNVTRVISTESSSYQRGDTSVVIHTRTTESYDATKRL